MRRSSTPTAVAMESDAGPPQTPAEPKVGDFRMIAKRDGALEAAEVVEIAPRGPAGALRYYVHYLQHDRRMDEWVGRGQIRGEPDWAHGFGSPALSSPRGGHGRRSHKRKSPNSPGGALASPRGMTPRGRNGHSDPTVAERLEHAREHMTRVKNVEAIVFSEWKLEPWYWAPFPEEYHDQTLYFCDFTLRYTPSVDLILEHRETYRASGAPRRPPGARCYGPDAQGVSLWEIDGEVETLYCQNLCLLAKLFLDHKTLNFDVEPFRYYALTSHRTADDGADEEELLGYFSKEKESRLAYNLACILTMPQHQRKGLGTLMIDLSYALTQREGKMGSPEKPLSDLGKLSYRSYWTWTVLTALKSYDSGRDLKDVSRDLGLAIEDVISTLQHLDMIREWKGQMLVRLDYKEVASKLKSIKRPPRLCDPSKVCWTPPAD